MGILDLLFPKTCVGCARLGSYLCIDCLAKIDYLETQVCSSCYKNSIDSKTHSYCSVNNPLDGVVSLANYQSPVRELIHQLKYRLTTDLVKEFSEKFHFAKLENRFQNFTLLPLPLHKQRQNFRGFNQAELLGKIVAEKLGLKFDPKTLVRVKKTNSQVGLSKTERAKNLETAFKVVNQLKPGKYIVFDDVWTSGASLKAAAFELKKAGAVEVWGLTLAHKR